MVTCDLVLSLHHVGSGTELRSPGLIGCYQVSLSRVTSFWDFFPLLLLFMYMVYICVHVALYVCACASARMWRPAVNISITSHLIF